MQSGAVVEALDVIEDVTASLRSRLESEVVEPFGLDRMEETLRESIVQAVAGATHAAADAVAVEEVLVLGAAVLGGPIAVMDEPGRRPTSPQGDPQRLKGQVVADAIGSGPTD